MEGVGDNDFVCPCLQVLPMGWSWSLHFCQSFVSNIVSKVLGQDRMILDGSAGVVIDSSRTHVELHMLRTFVC